MIITITFEICHTGDAVFLAPAGALERFRREALAPREHSGEMLRHAPILFEEAKPARKPIHDQR